MQPSLERAPQHALYSTPPHQCHILSKTDYEALYTCFPFAFWAGSPFMEVDRSFMSTSWLQTEQTPCMHACMTT